MFIILLVFFKFRIVQSGQFFTSLTELRNNSKNWRALWCVYGRKFLSRRTGLPL